MAAITGSVRVTGYFAPSDTTDTYAVTDEKYNRGGYRSVSGSAERLAITADRRVWGMLVKQLSDNTYWTLQGGIADGNWVQVFNDTIDTSSFNQWTSSLETWTASAQTSIDALNAVSHSHDNKPYLDSIDQFLSSTSSATFSGITVNGNISASGDIHARIFYIQSSSIIWDSGSTKFGNTPDDTHQFTGSLFIAGDINGVQLNSSGSNTHYLSENGTYNEIIPSIGSVHYVPSSSTYTVLPNFQNLVYGDIIVSGTFNNQDDITIINGNLIATGSGIITGSGNINLVNLTTQYTFNQFSSSINIAISSLQSSSIIDTTYNDLAIDYIGETLLPGRFYRITDYQTIYLMPSTNEIHSGSIEPLIVLATSTSSIDKQVYSELYPQDIIYYDISDNSCEDGTLQIIIPHYTGGTSRPGRITYRHDLINNISTYYDWRNVKFRRWKIATNNWADGLYLGYTSSNYTQGQSDIIVSSSDYQDYYTFTILTDLNNSSGVVSTGIYTGLSINNIHIGELNFVSAYMKSLGANYNNTIFLIPNEVGVAGFHDVVLNNNYYNTIMQNCNYISNTGELYYNLIYEFKNNTITDLFYNNIIYSCINNTLNGQIYSNEMSKFYNNIINSEVKCNLISQSFKYNTIQNKFMFNNLNNSCENNIIFGIFSYNTGSNIRHNKFQYNTNNNLIDEMNYNTMNKVFQYNSGSMVYSNIFNSDVYNNNFYMCNANICGDLYNNNNYNMYISANKCNTIFNNIADSISNNNVDTISNNVMGSIDNNIGILIDNNIDIYDISFNKISTIQNITGSGSPRIYHNNGDSLSNCLILNDIIMSYNNFNYIANCTMSGDFYNNQLNRMVGSTINIFDNNIIKQTFDTSICVGDFKHNNIYCEINGVDFTTASFVYGNYDCDIFKNSAGSLKLKFYDGNDILQIANITD